jgi:hypothetical protein
MDSIINAVVFQKRATWSRKQVTGTLDQRMWFSQALSPLQRVARGNQIMPAARLSNPGCTALCYLNFSTLASPTTHSIKTAAFVHLILTSFTRYTAHYINLSD